MEILKNPNFDFLGKTRTSSRRACSLILAGVAYIAHPGGLALRRRVLGRHPAHREVPEPARGRPHPRRGGAGGAGRGDPDLRRAGQEPGADPPGAGGEAAEGELDAPGRRRCSRRSPPTTRENPVRRVRPPRSWARWWAPSCGGRPSSSPCSASSSSSSTSRSASRARSGAPAATVAVLPRRAGHPGLPRLLPLRDHAQRDRRPAHPRGLQRQRHHRHLRPRAREPAPPAQGPAAQDPERLASTRP